MSITATITVDLSTVFTPPVSCSTSWTYEPQSYNHITSGILLQNALPSYMDVECFPSGFSQGGRVFLGQVFSPGACPHGYTTYSPIQISDSATTATCCLSDFSYYSSSLQGCLSVWSGNTSLLARAGPPGGFSTSNTITSTSISGTFTMWALPVTVELHASDTVLYTTITSTSISSMLPSVPTTSVGKGSSSSTAIAEPQSSGLSNGTKAGIAVGVVAGVLVIIGIGLFFLRKYRKVGLAEMSDVNYQTEFTLSCHNHTTNELENNEVKKPIAELSASR